MNEMTSAPYIRNAWYVGAWDEEVTADGLFGRTLLGEPIVFFRGADGAAVALEDRCCHRAAPLSIGRKEADGVRCMYHGMKFDNKGVCIDIPGQEKIPVKACVRAYPLQERDRFIWIWMGDPALANPADIPSFWWHTDPAWCMKPAQMHYQANYQLIVDNLLDFSHLTFVHEQTIGIPSIARSRAQVEKIEGGLQITRWFLDGELPLNQKRVAAFTGLADRWQIYQWLAPAMMLMHAGASPAGTGAQEGRYAPETIQFRHTSVVTPESEGSAHYFYCQARNFKLDEEGLSDAVLVDVTAAFLEDKAMIEAQQRVLNLSRRFVPVATAHDAALVQARRLIQERIDAESISKDQVTATN